MWNLNKWWLSKGSFSSSKKFKTENRNEKLWTFLVISKSHIRRIWLEHHQLCGLVLTHNGCSSNVKIHSTFAQQYCCQIVKCWSEISSEYAMKNSKLEPRYFILHEFLSKHCYLDTQHWETLKILVKCTNYWYPQTLLYVLYSFKMH
jgi:hypothetical protein